MPVLCLDMCLLPVLGWMRVNKVNPEKTEVLLVSQKTPLKLQLASLGALLDSTLSFNAPVSVVAKIAFAQLKVVHQLHMFLEISYLAPVTHALVTSCLDSETHSTWRWEIIWRLQLVQNAAARL